MRPISRRLLLQAGLGAVTVLKAANPSATIKSGGAEIEVSFESNPFDLPKQALLDWVRQAAAAVTRYFGRFPVPHALIRIYQEGRPGVSHGTTYGDDGAWTRISVGRETTVEDLDDDWMLTHEMVHYSFPSVRRRHHWIEEGIATYVEPIARVQVGNLTAARVWSDVMRDLPQGLPEEGDRGLDNTHTWGRTYWGGALFCLMADIDIRKNTKNAKGLEDALRAINRAGGNIEQDWPLEHALEIGDQATDGKTLRDLYAQMAEKPVMVDLPDLWRQLGIARRDGKIAFDDHAPLAVVRESIMQPRPQ